MDSHVLVLNKSWVAVNVTPLRRALVQIFDGGARVVDPEDFSLHDFDSWCALSRVKTDPRWRYIRTPGMRIRVPEVILLERFNRVLRPVAHLSRRNIFLRDRNTCQYCGRRFAKHELTIDHVIPRSRGGIDAWENLVLACLSCNTRKKNRTPEEAKMPLLRRPFAPRWLPRFSLKIPPESLSTWQQFVDIAYWNVQIGGDEEPAERV